MTSTVIRSKQIFIFLLPTTIVRIRYFMNVSVLGGLHQRFTISNQTTTDFDSTTLTFCFISDLTFHILCAQITYGEVMSFYFCSKMTTLNLLALVSLFADRKQQRVLHLNYFCQHHFLYEIVFFLCGGC